MRSLKECYEIAKQHHVYWAGDDGLTHFMCLAADIACDCGELTKRECNAVTKDAMSLVDALDPDFSTLIEALSSAYDKEFTDEEVKAFWDRYIDNMENQDG